MIFILIHFLNQLKTDVITDYPDKKSIMMYVMCYFQVLSKPKVIIESKDSAEVCHFFYIIASYLKKNVYPEYAKLILKK